MTRRLALSPSQSSAFAMSRVLLVLDAWREANDAGVDLDRAILLDFAVQHPRALASLVPDVQPVVRAFGLQGDDVADLFAQRHLDSRRERFTAVLTDLLARDLVAEAPRQSDGSPVLLIISDLGKAIAASFTSPLSLTVRALAGVFSRAWRRPRVDDLLAHIRGALPDHALDIAHFAEPFSADGDRQASR
jgi:hypothetical protein